MTDILTMRNGKYYVDTYIDGRRLRKSTGTADYSEAKRRLGRVLGGQPATPKFVNFEQPIAAGGDLCLRDAFRKITAEEWQHQKDAAKRIREAEEIERFFGAATPLVHITRDRLVDLQSHWRDTGVTNRTINRKMAVIKRLLNVAEADWGALPSVPKVRNLKEAGGRHRYLSDRELKELMRLTHPEWVPIWTFLVETGFRVGELLGLRWDNFDLHDGIVGLLEDAERSLKTDGSSRVVPLSPGMLNYLKARESEGKERPLPRWLKRHTLRHEWDRVKKEMGLVKDRQFVPHALRHTCATRLVNSGAPTTTVKQWLGHSNIATTAIYTNQNVNDLRRHIGGVSLGDSRK